MALLLGDYGTIQSEARFNNRIYGALTTAASAVYTEANIAPTSVGSSSGTRTLSFSTSTLPGWVGVGGGIANLTSTTAIPPNAVITGISTAAVVTISAPLAGPVGSGDSISFTQHAQRANYASRVANGNFNLQAACFIVLSNTTITAEGVVATQPDNAIPDADIQFAVNSNWNLLAGA